MAAIALAKVMGNPSNRTIARCSILSDWDFVYDVWEIFRTDIKTWKVLSNH